MSKISILIYSDADVRTFLCKKLRIFFEIHVCPHGKGGRVEPVRTWGRGVNFARTFFMDGPLPSSAEKSTRTDITISSTILYINYLYITSLRLFNAKIKYISV